MAKGIIPKKLYNHKLRGYAKNTPNHPIALPTYTHLQATGISEGRGYFFYIPLNELFFKKSLENRTNT